MFQDLLERTKADLATVRAVLHTNEALRSMVFAPEHESAEFLTAFQRRTGTTFPDARRWRIYDHSACVTRLYAVYERCVHEAVKGWLTALPNLIPSYSDLTESVRKAHRNGIARILQNVDRERFKHLIEYSFVKGFHDAVSGGSPYELLPDAFLFHDSNLRKQTLESVLASVAIENSWAWISGSRFTSLYIERLGRGLTTPEAELRTFVDYRNDAAHGAVDQTLGMSTLLGLADLIEAVCLALCELTTWNVLSSRVKRKESNLLGTVTERYDRPQAVVATMDQSEVSVGDRLYVVGKCDCFDATVTSIHLDGHAASSLGVFPGTELGFQFDVHVPKDRQLYRW